jgi:hypothetical protein
MRTQTHPIQFYNNQAAMKIEHTTYDECHTGWWRTSQKVKGLISSPNSRTAKSHQLSNSVTYEARPTTLWLGSHCASRPGLTKHSTDEKKTDRQGWGHGRASSEVISPEQGGFSANIHRSTADKNDQEAHLLRRKPKFSEVSEEKTYRAGEKKDMAKIQALRQKMREGEMERAVPPEQALVTQTRYAYPPRALPKDCGKGTLPVSGKKRSEVSSLGKLAKSFEVGVDVIEERRRELSGKFRAPFDFLGYPISARGGRDHKVCGSDHSTESFFCIGEELAERPQPSRTLDQLAARRRLSGEGTSPWEGHPPSACRLCRKAGVRGIRGLCSECEQEFLRPKTVVKDATVNDEVKPTPPLKDRRILRQRSGGKQNHSTWPELRQVGCKPSIINSATRREHAHRARVEYDDEKFLEWQTPEMREEYHNTQGMFARWTDSYEKDDTTSFNGDEAHLFFELGKEEKENTLNWQKDSYSFYDDIFRQYGHQIQNQTGREIR